MTKRASKKNPYICDHCGTRLTCYWAMKNHLRDAHNDRTTDPREKWLVSQQA